MRTRNRNAVNATPNSVDDKGEVAAVGYACTKFNHVFQIQNGTHDDDPPRGCNECSCRGDENDKLVGLCFIRDVSSYLTSSLCEQQTGKTFQSHVGRTTECEESPPPSDCCSKPRLCGLRECIEGDEEEERVHRDLHDGEGIGSP